VAIDRMYAYFDIDERTLLRLRRLVRAGKMPSRTESEVPVLASLADADDFHLRGTIDFSENRLDPNTGTLQVRAVIANPKPFVLSPGMFLRVRLPIGPPHDALMVAEAAVGSDQGRKFLYVLNARDEVLYRPVTVGTLGDDGRRVIEEGLRPDERVVVSGLQRIRPGVKVVPKPAAQVAARDGSAAPTPRRVVPSTGG
jgi:RND family efflux transporter MFP subunit